MFEAHTELEPPRQIRSTSVRLTVRLSVRFVILLLLFGCEDPSAQGDLHVNPTVSQIGDTIVVRNHFPSHPDTSEMIEIGRVFGPDASEDLQLYGWTQLTVGPAGEVYVSDPSGVRVIKKAETQVKWIARRGQGPGEILSVSGMAVDNSGRLAVVDQENRRISLLSSEGTLLSDWPLPPGRTGFGMNAITPTNDGFYLLPFYPPVNPGEDNTSFPRPIFLRLAPDGGTVDTLYVPLRLHEDCPFEEDAMWRTAYLGDTREAFVPKILWSAGRDGELILGCPSKFELEKIDSDQRVLRFSVNKPPFRSSRQERDWFVDGFEKSVRVRVNGWSWTGLPPPLEKPFFRRILVGRYGRIWTWPGLPGVPGTRNGQEVWRPRRTGAFDVFDPDGTFLGSVRLPEGAEFRPFPGLYDPFIAGDTVWIFRQDSLDVKYLSKMVVRW